MNRILMFGVATFVAFVGLSLMGAEREASASLLNRGFIGKGCDGAKAKSCGRVNRDRCDGRVKRDRCSGRVKRDRCSGRVKRDRCSGRVKRDRCSGRSLKLKGGIRRGVKAAPAPPKSDAPPKPPKADAKKA